MSGEKRWKVLITRNTFPEAVDALKEECDVDFWDEEFVMPRSELLQRVKGQDGMYCMVGDSIDKDLLDGAGSSLRVISTMSVGYDHIYLPALKKRNILLGNTPGVLTEDTAELVIGLLLATSRRLIEANQQVVNGGWSGWSLTWMCGTGLSGSTVGIVGLGFIGHAVGQRLKPFGVKRFLYCGHTPKAEAHSLQAEFVSLDELLVQSDFVIVTCALTPETTGMFNQSAFQKMKKTAIFVNASRGGVVCQDDLVEALQSGTISAAGLDVTTPEPLPLDSPLLKLSNCVVLPHIGSATIKTRTDMAMLAAKNLLAGLKGEPMPAQVLE